MFNIFVYIWNVVFFKGVKVKSVDVKKYLFESKGIVSVFNDVIKGLKLFDLEIDERLVLILFCFDNY